MATRPGTYNILLQRRADYQLPLQFKDCNENPINLTGWKVYAQVWDKGRTTKYADFAVTYTSRPDGKIEISLSRQQTTQLPDEAFYDVLMENPSGVQEYYLEGSIYVSQGYTEKVES